MSFGDAWGFGADEKESNRILGAFTEAGGNFLDRHAYHAGSRRRSSAASSAPDATAGHSPKAANPGNA
jgi:hypothetical protein